MTGFDDGRWRMAPGGRAATVVGDLVDVKVCAGWPRLTLAVRDSGGSLGLVDVWVAPRFTRLVLCLPVGGSLLVAVRADPGHGGRLMAAAVSVPTAEGSLLDGVKPA